MIENDTYKTIDKPSEAVLYKDKNSKFYGYAFPVTQEEEIKNHIDEFLNLLFEENQIIIRNTNREMYDKRDKYLYKHYSIWLKNNVFYLLLYLRYFL